MISFFLRFCDCCNPRTETVETMVPSDPMKLYFDSLAPEYILGLLRKGHAVAGINHLFHGAFLAYFKDNEFRAPFYRYCIKLCVPCDELSAKPFHVMQRYLQATHQNGKEICPLAQALGYPAEGLMMTAAQWANPTNLPPMPKELQDFLAGECTIWPGKTRSETHIVVPLFPLVEGVDGSPVPCTLQSLHWLDRSSGGPGFRRVYAGRDDLAASEFHWAVMTKDVLPGSRKKPYAEQVVLLPPGYEVPRVIDAARAILWENRRSGTRCFTDNPDIYTRCIEATPGGYRLVVGDFAPAGLCVVGVSDYVDIGVAGWRLF